MSSGLPACRLTRFTVVLVVVLVVAAAGCSGTSQTESAIGGHLEGESGDTLDYSASLVLPDRIEIVAREVALDVDAPNWCQGFVSKEMGKLPSSMLVLGEEGREREVSDLMRELSRQLSSLEGAPTEVLDAASRLATTLELIGEGVEFDRVLLDRLWSDLEGLEATTVECGFH